jgi:phosphohistidine phosphatase
MELILWRHAEAEDANGKQDIARELTRKGRKQAERMAEWLRPRLDGHWRILVSPAKRALQTVKPLDLDFEVSEAVGLAATPADVLGEAGWPRGERPVIVVGHQPTLGEVAALLLLGNEGEATIRKGAIWWFEARAREGKMETILKAVMNPDLLDD